MPHTGSWCGRGICGYGGENEGEAVFSLEHARESHQKVQHCAEEAKVDTVLAVEEKPEMNLKVWRKETKGACRTQTPRVDLGEPSPKRVARRITKKIAGGEVLLDEVVTDKTDWHQPLRRPTDIVTEWHYQPSKRDLRREEKLNSI